MHRRMNRSLLPLVPTVRPSPIYSGILLAMLGTAPAASLYWLVAFAVLGSYFIYSATVEEKLLASSFPATYPSYKTKTKMLIPFRCSSRARHRTGAGGWARVRAGLRAALGL